jgi:hypothetical protein
MEVIKYKIRDLINNSVRDSVWFSVKNLSLILSDTSVFNPNWDLIRHSVWDSIRNSVWISVKNLIKKSVKNLKLSDIESSYDELGGLNGNN